MGKFHGAWAENGGHKTLEMADRYTHSAAQQALAEGGGPDQFAGVGMKSPLALCHRDQKDVHARRPLSRASPSGGAMAWRYSSISLPSSISASPSSWESFSRHGDGL